MRSLVLAAVIFGPQVASADTLTVSLGGNIRVEHQLDLSMDLVVAAKVAPSWWVGGAVGIGNATLFDPGGSGQGDTSLVGGRVLGRYMHCRTVACFGVEPSVGYLRVRMTFDDSLLTPPHRVDRDDTVFVEARGVLQLRLVSALVLDFTFGPAIHEAIYSEGDGLAVGFVTGIDLGGMF